MSQPTQDTTFTFTDSDGFKVFVRRWVPPEGVQPKAVVQVAHGGAEHSLRYKRPAKFLNRAGYVVYANDHRGHWKTAVTMENAGFAGEDGWNGIVRDAKQLTDIIKKENPGLPVFLFGHSMGSLISQHYIQQWGSGLKGAVLCGSSGARIELDLVISKLAAKAREERQRPAGPRTLQQFDWLTRDKAEVQKYIDDPWCGFTFTRGFVLDMFWAMREGWKPENEARIPKDLPIYVISGELDRAAGENTASIRVLVERYQALGIRDVTFKIYPGARHELLNETNRDEVQGDILAWLNKHL
jgi:alpha-beta hydrolase superfamily lysophospholipase